MQRESCAALHRLGSAAFDAERGRVIRADKSVVELRPKAAEVACCLIAHAGHVVTREALMAAVWPNVFVTDDSITQCVVEFRRALGDDAALLRTLPRRGYLLDLPAPTPGPHPRSDAGSPPRPAEETGLAAAELPVRPAVATAPPQARDDRPSIVVLPFQSQPGQEQDQWFAAGVNEGIIHVLSGLDDLFVISQASSLAVTAPADDARRVGAELGVRYVLGGTVWRVGDRLRLTAKLTEADSGKVLRAEKLDGTLAALFEMQDVIAAQVVAAIAPTVRSHELQRAMRKPPESTTAYDRVLQALHLMPRLDESQYARAGDLLREAVATDPGYAPGWAYLALWHMIRIAQGWSPEPPKDADAAALCAEASLERDDCNAWALAIQGHLLSYSRRAFEAAAEVLDRAIGCGPNNPMAWAFRSATSSYLGDGAAAIDQAAHAIRLSPIDPFVYLSEHFMARAHYVAGDHAEAVRWGRRVVMRNPRHAANLRLLIVALCAVGAGEEARQVGAQMLALNPEFRIGAFAARTPLTGWQIEDFVVRLRQAGLPE